MKVCKEEFHYLYEEDISPICSVPTVCDLIRKFQHYSDKLEKVNDELAEKKNGLEIFAAEISSQATSADSCIEAVQKSQVTIRISSNLLGIQPLFKECPELILIWVKILSNWKMWLSVTCVIWSLNSKGSKNCVKIKMMKITVLP